MRKSRLLEGVALSTRFLRALGLARGARWARSLLRPLLGNVEVAVDGFRLCGRLEDWELLHRVQGDYFEPETVEALRGVLRPGHVAVDVGAHIGYYSLLAASVIGTHGRVYAFEPDPRNYALLLHNIRLNGLRNITAVPTVVSGRDGVAALWLHSADPSQNSLYVSTSSSRRIAVESVTLDRFLGTTRVNVIKLDVEGAELDVLTGTRSLLEANPEVVLFVELNPVALQRGGNSERALVTYLQRLGFAIEQLDRCVGADGTLISANLYCRRR